MILTCKLTFAKTDVIIRLLIRMYYCSQISDLTFKGDFLKLNSVFEIMLSDFSKDARAGGCGRWEIFYQRGFNEVSFLVDSLRGMRGEEFQLDFKKKLKTTDIAKALAQGQGLSHDAYTEAILWVVENCEASEI